MSNQHELFGFHDMRPRPKVPISAERIREIKALIAAGDGKNAAITLRDVREKLENYERRLKNR
jgi:hypothetical protein